MRVGGRRGGGRAGQGGGGGCERGQAVCVCAGGGGKGGPAEHARTCVRACVCGGVECVCGAATTYPMSTGRQ